MSHSNRALYLGAILLGACALLACDKQPAVNNGAAAPRKAAAAPEKSSTPGEAIQETTASTKGGGQPGAESVDAKETTPAAGAVAEPTESAKKLEPTAPDKAPVKAPLVSEAQCKAACDNVLKISLADSKSAQGKPAGSMAAIEARVKADCPAQCLKHGTPDAVACLSSAKTAGALAACPR